ncbi:uncharacterized protein BT62DRAFT_1009297 [Guyanagaster necrorhizus]|uniref:Uncharacterized protein n=1 Tax=Guyanagaster necrorhizus TaxID=856835 RepID=A0A9P7VMX7_9AGAR|nr:uncharacterized protein BT62DRAFT_1009297 [Guyanagaster necrorhizus MCA 3950]KAG7443483.1 hypothetical protein BT62DRAFT_1009297 [Guyanagaster necrorhizus MCA 3950]
MKRRTSPYIDLTTCRNELLPLKSAMLMLEFSSHDSYHSLFGQQDLMKTSGLLHRISLHSNEVCRLSCFCSSTWLRSAHIPYDVCRFPLRETPLSTARMSARTVIDAVLCAVIVSRCLKVCGKPTYQAWDQPSPSVFNSSPFLKVKPIVRTNVPLAYCPTLVQSKSLSNVTTYSPRIHSFHLGALSCLPVGEPVQFLEVDNKKKKTCPVSASPLAFPVFLVFFRSGAQLQQRLMVQPMDDDIFICTEQVNRPLEGIGRRPLDLAASPSSSPTFPLRPGSYYNGQQRFADMHTLPSMTYGSAFVSRRIRSTGNSFSPTDQCPSLPSTALYHGHAIARGHYEPP